MSWKLILFGVVLGKNQISSLHWSCTTFFPQIFIEHLLGVFWSKLMFSSQPLLPCIQEAGFASSLFSFIIKSPFSVALCHLPLAMLYQSAGANICEKRPLKPQWRTVSCSSHIPIWVAWGMGVLLHALCRVPCCVLIPRLRSLHGSHLEFSPRSYAFGLLTGRSINKENFRELS